VTAQKNFRRGGSYPPPEVRHGFEKPQSEFDRFGGMLRGSLKASSTAATPLNIPAASA